ncbi:MAG: class B sortase [Clostridia bacterium]|nr:class B sortase [Clostridia bacterium]
MKKRKIVWLILAIIFFLLFLGSSLLLMHQLGIFGKDDGDRAKEVGKKGNHEDIFTTSATVTEPTDGTHTDGTGDTVPEPPLPDNPIDFENLWGYNTDIYAWIEVPGTPIDYPILQSDESSDYYHRRNWLGQSDVAGCIYTQYYNRKDFTDPNTVIYGHYMWNGTFFGSLHDFRDPEFFAQNRYIYIYIPGHALKYEIFAAYEYDNRHILNAYNFSSDEEFEKYLQTCLNPASMSRNVLEGVTLTSEDRIVTLSTCLANGDSSKRYLVQGVLVEDVRTK